MAIFDLDGTLLDTSEGVLSSVKYTINLLGLNLPNTEVLESFIGPPVQNRFRELYDLSDEQITDAANIFRTHYKDIDLLKAKPYQGIFEVLHKLQKRNIQIGIATYKRQDYTNTILHYFGFDKYTNNIVGSDFAGKLTKKDIIMLCLQHAGINKANEVLMIGDTQNDAIGADALEIDFLAVKYGFGFKTSEDVAQVNHVGSVEHAIQILDWFKENEDES